MAQEPSSMRRSLMWGAIAFGVVFAAVVGVRLEQAALTVVVGVACGVGASIPTSLLIVMLLQARSKKQVERKQRLMGQSPPVVIVTPQTAPQIHQPGRWPEEYTLPIPSQRQFSVIGDEETTDL